MDHYYTSIIKKIVEIIKRSTTDRQIALVNTARAFKYLEDFRQRQSQLSQAITAQQTYTANLCTYINNILPCIIKLEEAIHKFDQKLTMEQDTVQISATDLIQILMDQIFQGPTIIQW